MRGDYILLDIDFVILNYNVFRETIDCAESIIGQIDTEQYHVIIVDNASPNGVGEKIKAYFSHNIYVSCIDSGGNLGFACGNNVGIEFARKNFPAKFICCLNNDTLLEQKDFFKNLKKEYQNSQAAVIGPKIILRNGTVQPLVGELLTIDDYQQQLRWCIAADADAESLKGKIKRRLLRYPIIRRINAKRHQMMKHQVDEKVDDRPDLESRDLVLHGCCLIFTPKFFECLSGFNPKTFMFREEELLFLSLKNHGLHSFYTPSLQIRHLEDVSTDTVFYEAGEKERFLRKNQIKSLRILIDELSDNSGGL